MPQERLSKQTLYAEVCGKRTNTSTNMMARLYQGYWLKPFETSSKKNAACAGGLRNVIDHSRAALSAALK